MIVSSFSTFQDRRCLGRHLFHRIGRKEFAHVFAVSPCISDVTRCNNPEISDPAPLGVEAVPDVVAVPVNSDDLSVVVHAQSVSAVRAVGINLSRMGLLSGSVSEPKVPPLLVDRVTQSRLVSVGQKLANSCQKLQRGHRDVTCGERRRALHVPTRLPRSARSVAYLSPGSTHGS